MAETILEELKRYVGFDARDEQALRALHPVAQPHFVRIAEVFYERILANPGAREALQGGESRVGHLKGTLERWMDELLRGPWDDAYYELRSRIGRMHVRINLPQHYMFGAMNVLRRELNAIVDTHFARSPQALSATRGALAKVLDLELAVMLHTYREDLLSHAARAERLATFGQLVGSIGHELRNPLGVIETSLYILRGRPFAQEERVAKHLERIGQQVRVSNHIISSLLDMIRDRPLARERVRLGEVWAEALGAVSRPEGVRVTSEGLEGLPEVLGDAGQLRQVLVNLLDNAVQALGEAGEVRLAAGADGAQARLVLEDSGPGLDPAVQARLFEPLMSTKTRGLGLGLPLVRRILERHGGSIAYAPRPGVGARFVLTLPLAPAAAPSQG